MEEGKTETRRNKVIKSLLGINVELRVIKKSEKIYGVER